MKRKPFTWYDLSRLMDDTTYPNQLATGLQYSDPIRLAEVLKDCTEILLARREGVKDYENMRNKHINQAVLSDLSKWSGKIKKLCKSDKVGYWVKSPSFKLYFVEFHFEIDQMDLLSLMTLNHFDEAISAVAICDLADPNTKENLDLALQCWEMLQVRKAEMLESQRMGEVFLKLYKTVNKHKQAAAGRVTAAGNRMRAVGDDLRIAYILLFLLSDETNNNKCWHSLNAFVDALLNAVNERLQYVKLRAQSAGLESVSEFRLNQVIKEINHFNSGLLGSFVKKPIPGIKAEDSRWKHYKIVEKLQPNLQFTYLDRDDE